MLQNIFLLKSVSQTLPVTTAFGYFNSHYSSYFQKKNIFKTQYVWIFQLLFVQNTVFLLSALFQCQESSKPRLYRYFFELHNNDVTMRNRLEVTSQWNRNSALLSAIQASKISCFVVLFFQS